MDFKVPELGEGIYEAELVAWRVKPGDQVRRGEVLMEVLTDKATMEVPSPFAGRIVELRARPGQQVKVGDVVLAYEGRMEDGAEPARPEAARPRAIEPEPAAAGVRAAPSVRMWARKLGFELSSVRGSGPGGRILVEDLAPRRPAGDGKPRTPPQDFGKPGTRVKLQGLRRRIAEHMVHAARTIPHYSYVDECDATDLVRLRETLRPILAEQGTRLTLLAFIVKAAALALGEVPMVNASLDEEREEIVLHEGRHVGIAVATPGGLVVPVIRDAERKDVPGIARDIERLSGLAREGKLALDDLRGGTFSVTSIGNIGGLFSAPIIHHPQVGILGVGKTVRRPVFDAQGGIRAADLLYLSFSFDHRVVDGAVGASFGNAVIRRLQAPAQMLLS